MLRKIRIILALLFFTALTLLLAGFRGVMDTYVPEFFSGAVGNFLAAVWDSLPKLQFLPAVLSVNVGVILLILALTLLFGRIYCSVICPLGVFQDFFTGLRRKIKIRGKKLKFKYKKENRWVRYGIFGMFVISLLAGFQLLVLLLAPYSLYGRFVNTLLHDYGWQLSVVAIGMALLIAGLAFFTGRTWCNTICPVGTALSFLSRHSVMRPVIDADKCRSCHACERQCKAQCIDISHHQIDYSRCVTCFDCLSDCKFDALHYVNVYRKPASDSSGTKPSEPADPSRRAFLVSTAIAGLAIFDATADAQTRQVRKQLKAHLSEEGKDDQRPMKEEPQRQLPVVPPGAVSRTHFYDHCTACHLCVVSCPNQVIRPSLRLDHFMQVELSYAKNACDPECNRCSQVCPAGAIVPYMLEEKKNQRMGLATVDLETCYFCGRCSHVCPYGAIEMKVLDPSRPRKKAPVVHPDLCVGCGTCELLCPVRPVSAIHVEGLPS